MVRTKADGCTKASGGKIPSKQVSRSTPSSTTNEYTGGGNVVKVWPTPDWQKGVESFFTKTNIKPQENNENSNLSEENATSVMQQSPSCISNSASELPGVSSKDHQIETIKQV